MFKWKIIVLNNTTVLPVFHIPFSHAYYLCRYTYRYHVGFQPEPYRNRMKINRASSVIGHPDVEEFSIHYQNVRSPFARRANSI